MVFTPVDPTKAEVRVTQDGGQLFFDFYIPRGAKGEPGGITQPAQIAPGTDFNNITTSGLYWSLGADLAGFTNAPSPLPAGTALSMMVVARSSTILDQHVTLTSTSTIAKVRMERSQITGTWGPWRATPSWTLKDDTTGRQAYFYDWQNNRSNLLYGDTGRRNISSLANGTFSGGGKLTIRREGSMVDLYCVGWMPGADGVVQLLNASLPNGFRPSNSRSWFGVQNGSPVLCTLAFDASTLAVVSNAATTHPVSFSFAFSTTDPWPTALPGSADGAIPTI